jgi:hypothetical protein
MKPVILRDGEMVVNKDTFGYLVESFINKALRFNRYEMGWLDKTIREWWPNLEGWYQRHIITAIEVEILMNEPPRTSREPLEHIEVWKKLVADLRGPKHPFTIDYLCHKCKTKNVKLWRGVHGCADGDGNELLCATCLAPEITVSDKGKAMTKLSLHVGDEIETDQVKGWLPAIPVDDTYWGYSSVPSQDVEWWVTLPTYPSK